MMINIARLILDLYVRASLLMSKSMAWLSDLETMFYQYTGDCPLEISDLHLNIRYLLLDAYYYRLRIQ